MPAPAPPPGTIREYNGKRFKFRGGENVQGNWEPVEGPAPSTGSAPDLSAWGPGATALPNGNVVRYGPRGGVTVLGTLPPQGSASIDRTAPGARYLPTAPMRGGTSEDAYYRDWRKADNTNVAAARSGIGTSRRVEGLLNRQAQQGQGTGGIYSVPVIGSIAGVLDPEIRELDALQARAARANRTPGEGAISDYDAQQFMRMTYGKDKPMATNRSLIRAQRMADDSVIQRRHYMEWYRNQFGTLSGSEEGWDRYAQDNPIFNPGSERAGTPQLNLKRKAWRAYFGAGGDERSTQSQQDIEGAAGRRKPGLTPELRTNYQRMFDAGQINRNANAGDRTNPYVAKTDAELKRFLANPTNIALWVMGPDGRMQQAAGPPRTNGQSRHRTSNGAVITGVRRVG